MILKFDCFPDSLNYAKLGEFDDTKTKNVWIFPNMEDSFGIIKDNDGEVIIDPGYYFITSGEALRKTEVLINDIEKLIEIHSDDFIIEQLNDMLCDINEFYKLLIKTKDSSLYLEVTKCEDGLYSGNICARKDKKVKKIKK